MNAVVVGDTVYKTCQVKEVNEIICSCLNMRCQ